jgi:hypothetical protein
VPVAQSIVTSIDSLPFSNSTLFPLLESSIHQPGDGALARTGVPSEQPASTDPPAVACSTDACGADAQGTAVSSAGAAVEVTADVAAEVGADGAGAVAVTVDSRVDDEVARSPGDADASTRETARKPSPTAATADALHAALRVRVRFMAQRVQPLGLRPPQEWLKNRSGSLGWCGPDVSVATWPSSWWWRTTNASAPP